MNDSKQTKKFNRKSAINTENIIMLAIKHLQIVISPFLWTLIGRSHSSKIRWTLLWGREKYDNCLWWEYFTRSSLPDVGTGKVHHSRRTAASNWASEGCLSRALTLLRGARFIAWRLRYPYLGECHGGPRHFWCHRACLGYGFALGPTLKGFVPYLPV